jgi:hypothetical protein
VGHSPAGDTTGAGRGSRGDTTGGCPAHVVRITDLLLLRNAVALRSVAAGEVVAVFSGASQRGVSKALRVALRRFTLYVLHLGMASWRMCSALHGMEDQLKVNTAVATQAQRMKALLREKEGGTHIRALLWYFWARWQAQSHALALVQSGGRLQAALKELSAAEVAAVHSRAELEDTQETLGESEAALEGANNEITMQASKLEAQDSMIAFLERLRMTDQREGGAAVAPVATGGVGRPQSMPRRGPG